MSVLRHLAFGFLAQFVILGVIWLILFIADRFGGEESRRYLRKAWGTAHGWRIIAGMGLLACIPGYLLESSLAEHAIGGWHGIGIAFAYLFIIPLFASLGQAILRRTGYPGAGLFTGIFYGTMYVHDVLIPCIPDILRMFS